MAWARVDDKFPLHPKTIEAGPMAAWLYVCGLCYCNSYLTDGFIPNGAVTKLGLDDAPLAAASALVKVGLWDKAQGGFRVHDYADHNKSKVQVADYREYQRKRKETWRQGLKTRKDRHVPASVPSMSQGPVPASVPGSVPESVPDSVPRSVPGDVPVVSHPIPSHPISTSTKEEVQELPSEKSRRGSKKKTTTALAIAKTPNDQRFEIFWNLHWPKTRRVGKKNAKREWDNLGVDDAMFVKMTAALAVMTKSAGWLKEGGHYIPHPERWLKNRRFDDDLDAYRGGSAEDANAALLEGRYGDKDQKLMDDGKTIDADFWPVDDEGGDDD